MTSGSTCDPGKVVIAYDNGCVEVRFPRNYSSDPYFKVKLKRYFEKVDDKVCIVNRGYSPGELRRLEQAIADFADREGLGYEADSSFGSHIATMEDHIMERRRVGTALKNHVESVSVYISDFRSVVDQEMVRPLREQQLWDAYFMCIMRKSANFSVPGSGKTAAVYGMYCYLRHIGLANKLVVISPINSFGAWIDEYEASFGRSPSFFSIQDRGGMSVSRTERFLRYDSGSTELFQFNYESLVQFGDIVRNELVDDRTLVVLDEVHRIKAVNGTRAKATMSAVQKARFLVALTGTPIPNSYADLYNLFNIIFGSNYRNLLGMTPKQMSSPAPMEVETINQALYPFYCRTDKHDLGVPPPNEDKLIHLNASEMENRLLEELSFMLQGSPLAMVVRTLQMESDPDMLLQRVDERTLESIGVEYRELPELNLRFPHIDSTKTCACVDYVADLVAEGKSVVVWCMFVRSIDNITVKLGERGVKVRSVYGAVPLDDRKRILDSFKNGDIQVLVANPHTLAESISLHTVCHDAVYFEYSYNLVHLLQSKDRIHRLGLPDGQYTQYHYMVMHLDFMGQDYSLDQRIYERLLFKEHVMLDAISDRRLETMSSEDEDVRIVLGPLFDLTKPR